MHRRPEVIRLTPLGQLLRLPAMLVALAIVLLYLKLRGRESMAALFADPAAAAVLVGAYLLSIPLHEGLHVFGFRKIGSAPPGSTRVRWAGLSAFTHCAVPIRANAYRVAVALPGAVLGLAPLLVGFTVGNAGLTLYGALLTASAIGDLRVIIALRSVPADATVEFVPEERGYRIVRQPSASGTTPA